ncbi:MAG: hypothetical protein R3D62_12050 [Xanthobacteraceae bacterium]
MVDAVNDSWARALRNPALARAADGLALVAVVALPWSTSITSIAIALWLIALLPTLDLAALRRELMTPAGGFPVLVCLLAALGMLWAAASWGQRFDALNGYIKLLIIPLLLVQFRCSDRGWQVVAGYSVDYGAAAGILDHHCLSRARSAQFDRRHTDDTRHSRPRLHCPKWRIRSLRFCASLSCR